jgi:outer membrane protein insertion porin family
VASADVETERGPEGVVVHFRLVAAERIFAAPTPQEAKARVAEVRVRGNRRIESGAIQARIATRPGGPYSPAQIAKDVKEVHSLGFFRDVRVFHEPSPRGWIVIFEVEESPVVRQISISGNESVESDKIRDILTLTTGSTLDYPLLFENRGRIEALYRAEGFFLADVEFEIEPIGEASVGIHFQVTENEKLRLKRVVFTGNEHFSDRELREEFQTKPWRFWSYATSWFDRSGTYSEPLFIQDLRAVEKRYTDAGFLRVEVGRPDVVPQEGGLIVTVSIREGQRFRAGTIDVSGDATVDIEVLREKLNLKEGEIFNRSYLTEDVSQLTEHYTDRGFYFASVTPLTRLAEEAGTVDVVFEIHKGPLYFIRRIDVAGNTMTVDSVVRREIPIVEGQLYSQRAILLARARVQRLGFFEEVEFDMKPTDEPDQLDLEVSVVERPTGSFSFGAGYSSQDNFVFMGSLSQSNLFGRGYAAQLSADLGGRSQRFFLSFSDPRAFGSTFSLGTTIFRTTVRFEDFEQEQIGADLVLGHALTEDNRSRGGDLQGATAGFADQQPGGPFLLGRHTRRPPGADPGPSAGRIARVLGSRFLLAIPARRGAGRVVPRCSPLALRPLDLRRERARGLHDALQRDRRLRLSAQRRRSPRLQPAAPGRDRHRHRTAAVGALLPRRPGDLPAPRLQEPLRGSSPRDSLQGQLRSLSPRWPRRRREGGRWGVKIPRS